MVLPIFIVVDDKKPPPINSIYRHLVRNTTAESLPEPNSLSEARYTLPRKTREYSDQIREKILDSQ